MKKLKSTKRTENGVRAVVGRSYPPAQIDGFIGDFDTPGCGKPAPGGTVICTRIEGHEGPHIATGCEKVYAIWEER